MEVRARLERRPRAEPPTGDDAATCRASGDEPTSHEIGGVTLPGSRMSVLERVNEEDILPKPGGGDGAVR